MHINVDILINIADRAGGVTTVVASVLLHEVGDGDGVAGDLPARVGLGLLDGLAVVNPCDLRNRGTTGLALDLRSLAFR